MTQAFGFVSIKQKNKPLYGQIFLGIFALFCLLLFLKNADVATTSIQTALSLCEKTLIPSLFPFLVLSELILSGSVLQSLLKKITFPLQRLLRLSPAGGNALLFGFLCGFPIGAKCTAIAYDKGLLSREEAGRLLAFSNLPSAAFLINVVGNGLFQSRRFGGFLYGCAMLSALLTGLLLALPKQKKKEEIPTLESPLFSKSPVGGASVFTGAVLSATRGMLLICAYVVFFSALSGALASILNLFSIPPTIQALLLGVLELSGGVSRATALLSSSIAAPVCAFLAGWSGFSVHCQVLSTCEGRGFAFGTYFLAKLLQGLLCSLLCILGMQLPGLNLL